MPHLTKKPLSWFKPDPNQPRKTFGLAELQFLGASLRIRQNDPVQANSDGTIIDGERRFRAAKAAGLTELDVIICDEKLSDSQIATIRLTSFFHREGLTHDERWRACLGLMQANGWDQQTLAAHLHLTPAAISKLMSPSKCTEAWQKALADGKVTPSDCEVAARLPVEQQDGLLALKLSSPGMNREKLKEASRKSTPKADTVKQGRVVCPLSTGTKITVTGPDMDLEGLIEALQSAIESARKANKDSLDVTTWAKVMADKAKAV